MAEQTENIVGMRKKIKAQAEHIRRLEQRIRELKQATPQPEQSGIRAIHAMILNALDRDAAEGKEVRGEMAAELRAALSAQGTKP